MMDTDPVLEDLMSQLGDFGRYQFRQHIFHVLSAFLAGIHMLTLVTVAPVPSLHRCYIDKIDAGELNYTFDAKILENYVPLKSSGELDFCSIKNEENITVGCNGSYVYDTTYFKTSRAMDWNLVCDKRWERAIIQTIYMFGVLMGAILLGSLADKYGRKRIFYISGIIQLIAGLSVAFVPNFLIYCGLLFFYGMFGSGGAYVTGFVLTMELVGPKRRTLCGTAFSAAFAVGVMVVAFWASFIENVTTLQAVYALHSLILIPHWWVVDESIRWLWGQGRYDEAVKIVENGVKSNGKNKSFDSVKYLSKASAANVESGGEDEPMKVSYGAGDLFRTPNIRKRALNVAFNWFANSLVYYGLSLNTGNLKGNPHLILFLIGLAEIPGYLLVILLVDKTGRRSLLTTLLLLGGTACIICAFISQGIEVTVLVMFGKMCIAGSFAIIYNYTAELFPTVIRNSAVGFGACSARFSGMLTPLIGLLDTVDKQLPTLVFGGVALLAATLALFLPETLKKEMPQTILDGERFGKGDTGYRTMILLVTKKSNKNGNLELDPEGAEARERLNANGF